MMIKYDKCNKCNHNTNISAEENNKRFIIENTNKLHINKVKVDGCLINNQKACDYLFEILDSCKKGNIKRIIYIELKGSSKGVEQAIQQIEKTIKYCEKKYNHNKDIPKDIYVVGSHTHPKMKSKLQIIRNNLMEEFNARLYPPRNPTIEITI